MHPRAAELIASLHLQPHPEGGFFRQTFRSSAVVQPQDGRGSRAALTTIYFLLTAGDVSVWHRVRSDEVWHYYEGAVLELFTANDSIDSIGCHVLGAWDGARQPVHVVPAGQWQAARSTGDYTLVGCTVGPGFEFDDFQLLRELPAECRRVRAMRPDLVSLAW